MQRIAALVALILTTALLAGCYYDPYTGTYVPCCRYYGYPYYRYPYYPYGYYGNAPGPYAPSPGPGGYAPPGRPGGYGPPSGPGGGPYGPGPGGGPYGAAPQGPPGGYSQPPEQLPPRP